MVLKNYVCCEWVSELSANSSMFVLCTPVEASIAHKNTMEMVVVIHIFLVVRDISGVYNSAIPVTFQP